MGQQAPQRVQSRVERRAGRSLDPFAVPAAVGHPVFDEPRGEPLDIGAEPGAIRERPRIDGAIDLAAPKGAGHRTPNGWTRRGPRRYPSE